MRDYIWYRTQTRVAGHYNRPDVFELIVHQEPRPVIQQNRAQAKPLPPTPKRAARKR